MTASPSSFPDIDKMHPLRISAIAALLLTAAAPLHAERTVGYAAELWTNAGNGDFAPYYMASNRFGTVTQRNSTYVRASVRSDMDPSPRFSYGFGADLVAGASSHTPYMRYVATDAAWTWRREAPANFWVQQLYGQIRWRSLFLEVGLKETGSAMLDDDLSSGDLTWSANARPMPGIRAGFGRWVDIPFTRGVLQFDGQLFYGRPTDDRWLRHHYNYYNSFITTGRWVNYKRAYFRTAPGKPLSVTFGMQAAAQFAGTSRTYIDGRLEKTERHTLRFRDFFDMIIPRSGEDYVKGNHVGSWDIAARYRFRSGHTLRAYCQWPWEDGSGIGKLNGWDGLWGLEYRAPGRAIVRGAVIEYIDFRNQSGPLHWDPVDNTGSNLPGEATGSDSYYNNFLYNGYCHYGMGHGTPFLMSPLYNTDGYMRYVDTRVQGFHIGVNGCIGPKVDYRLLYSWRTGWGDSYLPRIEKARCIAGMAEATIRPTDHLTVKAQIAYDAGAMYGHNFGAGISISYSGSFQISK